jgi:hypothetical protein
MCDFSEPLVPIILGLSLISLVSWLFAIRSSRRNPMASTPVVPDSEWRLGFVPKRGRSYRLCLRFDVNFTGIEDDYGIVVDYSCTGPDGLHVHERVGTGNIQPPARDRFINIQRNSSFSSTPGNSRHRATVDLASLGPFDESTEIVASGTLLLSSGATLNIAEIFFA